MIREELLGRDVEIVAAKNHSLNGLSGEVVDETQHTLRIETIRGRKTVLKAQASFRFDNTVVKGTSIVRRPHERTKTKITQWQKTINK
jgi:RNase P/RNase MRP subunit p29